MIDDEHRELNEPELNAGGTKVQKELKQILDDSEELALEPRLKYVLARNFNAYPSVLLNHLSLTDEAPIFKTAGKSGSQLSYEIAMARRLLRNEFKVKNILGVDDQEIADLVFAILVSDIGKAGPIEVANEGPELVVQRIFNQAIFTDVHKAWLQQASPLSFPKQMREAISNIPKDDLINTFKNGVFFYLPLDAYLYLIKKVAILHSKQDPELIKKAKKTFSLDQQERKYLLSMDINPATTPTRSFFTNSHIRFGRLFLGQIELNEEQRRVVPLALSHHLSQGVLPKGTEIGYFLSDPSLLRQAAFLEILDKFDAFNSRFREEDPSAARESTIRSITNNLKLNYNQYPELASAYRDVFSSMVSLGII